MNRHLFETCLPQSTLLGYNGLDSVTAEITNSTEMPSSDYITNISDVVRAMNVNVIVNETSNEMHRVDLTDTLTVAAFVLRILRPIICIFGLMGNILTLLILTRKRLMMACDGTEQTVHLGLTALAVSDFLFCLALLPYGFVKYDRFSYTSRNFQLIYVTYSNAFVNMFILTSTWLTVAMATSRYLAICHPFRARHLIGHTGTKVSIFLVYLLSLVFNIPRLFTSQIETLECRDGRNMYFRMPGYLTTNNEAHTVYIWIYFTIGISLPLAALAFCNICLIKALRESVKIRKRYRVPAAHVDSNHRITSILVTIVVMYIMLVSPAEILLFIQDRLSTDQNSAPALVLAVEVTNLLQMINFSCNFVLYFVLNVHFRRALRDMFCSCAKMHGHHGGKIQETIEFHKLNTTLNNTLTTKTTLPQ